MIVALDANCLVRWAASGEGDPGYQRLEHLFSIVSKSRGRVIIPTPAFAEFLVGAGAGAKAWIEAFSKHSSVQFAPFDKRAAVECAEMDKAAIARGDKRLGRTDAWQRIKIDRQIVAIALVAQANVLVSTDRGVLDTAGRFRLTAQNLFDLELPSRQHALPLPDPAKRAPASPLAGASDSLA